MLSIISLIHSGFSNPMVTEGQINLNDVCFYLFILFIYPLTTLPPAKNDILVDFSIIPFLLLDEMTFKGMEFTINISSLVTVMSNLVSVNVP